MFSKFFRSLIRREKADFESLIGTAVETSYKKTMSDRNTVLALQQNIDNLTVEKRRIKDELADLKKAKEIERVEIDHLVALKEERMELQISQKEIAMEKKFQKKELELRQRAYEDMVERINKAGSDMKEIYEKIMERLPNVNAILTNDSNVKVKARV